MSLSLLQPASVIFACHWITDTTTHDYEEGGVAQRDKRNAVNDLPVAQTTYNLEESRHLVAEQFAADAWRGVVPSSTNNLG